MGHAFLVDALYLTTVRHFDLTRDRAVRLAAVPWRRIWAACSARPSPPGCIGRGMHLVDARRAAFTVGAVLMTGMMFVTCGREPGARVALLCLGGFAHQTLSVTVITMSSDLFPQGEVGTATGVAGMAANLGVLLFTLCARFAGRSGRVPALLHSSRRRRSRRRRPALDVDQKARMTIRNPILRGFNPDPSIVRVGDDYFVATSTFEWFPGVQIHHSARPRELAAGRATIEPPGATRHARQSRFLWRLGSRPQLRGGDATTSFTRT
jgi:hypothetical protein